MRLEAVGVDDVRVQRLVQFYLHEWSARVPMTIGPDARFNYPDLQRFTATLFFVDDRIAGVALTAKQGAATHVEELYMLAGERRKGTGRQAARALLASAPGPWTVTVRDENPELLAFFRALKPYAKLEEPADGTSLLRFTEP